MAIPLVGNIGKILSSTKESENIGGLSWTAKDLNNSEGSSESLAKE